MNKFVLLIVAALLLLAFTFFPDDEVTLQHNLPGSVSAGEEVTAEFIVKKTIGIQFGKFQLDLPSGVVASAVELKGGQFSFSGSVAKVIWMQFPSEEETKISFKLKFSNEMNGNKTINAKFQYVTNNEKKSTEIAPHQISVVNASSGTEVEAKKDSSFASSDEPEQVVSVERIIEKDVNKNAFLVTVKIKKGHVKGFAKYMDALPAGLTATKGTVSGNGTFKFVDNKASVIWATLPSDEEIQATYFIKPIIEFNEKPLIKGSFSYVENETTRKAEASDVYLDVTQKSVEENIVSNDSGVKETTTETVSVVQPDKEKEEKVVSSNSGKDEQAQTNENITVTTEKTDGTTNKNVTFHVQIGAYKNQPSVEYFRKKYTIDEAIITDIHNGLNKYMVGKFNEYKSARDYRETIRAKGINGAFVTVYNSGKRITVQEALMILNQKWFR